MNGHTQFPKEREEGHLDEDEELDEDEFLEDAEGDEEKEMVTRVNDSQQKEPEKVCEWLQSQRTCHETPAGILPCSWQTLFVSFLHSAHD